MASEDQLEILLVEDNAADAGLIQANLRVGLGKASVTRADRLSTAIESLSSQSFTAVLLDLNLPDSSGLETFHRLSANSNGVPIVVLSGMEDAETAVEAVGAGADDYVQKNHYDAHTLARSVRFAIERNTRLKAERELFNVRNELSVAQNIQDSLYPKHPPEIPGFVIAAGVRSAGIGCGDYFDFVKLSDGRELIVVGDVAGHGMGPAIVMAETRACLRTLVDLNADPKEMMQSMNRLIYAATSPGMFVTLMMVVCDPSKKIFTYFNAGHPGWVLRHDGPERLTTHQIPLGMLLDVDHSACDQIALASGEVLIIPTDGIPEAPRGEDMFGTARLIESVANNRVASASQIVDAVFADATEFSSGEEQADDMTLVIVKAI